MTVTFLGCIGGRLGYHDGQHALVERRADLARVHAVALGRGERRILARAHDLRPGYCPSAEIRRDFRMVSGLLLRTVMTERTAMDVARTQVAVVRALLDEFETVSNRDAGGVGVRQQLAEELNRLSRRLVELAEALGPVRCPAPSSVRVAVREPVAR